jgi:hypothetical protein
MTPPTQVDSAAPRVPMHVVPEMATRDQLCTTFTSDEACVEPCDGYMHE